MLKRGSRNRSPVGRKRSFPGPFNLRLRYLPAITRTISSHRSEPVSLPPCRAKRFESRNHRIGPLRIFSQREGFAPRELEKFMVAQRLRHAERRVAVLARAEKFSRAA